MSLGLRIKTFRKAKQYTQQQLADKVEVSRIYIQALESNRRLPSMKLLPRIADALGVQVVDLLYSSADPESTGTGRVQLESVLDADDKDIWFRSKKLTEKERHRVTRVIEALIKDVNYP